MKVHNLLEDVVHAMVREAFTEEDTSSAGNSFCSCYHCQLDVVCYVLNRIPPEYVVSGRGVVHREAEYLENLQRSADLVASISEGMKKIRTTRRPHHEHDAEEKDPLPEGLFFNFPSIIGRVFSSATFEPLPKVLLALIVDGVPAKMMGPNWQNPYLTAERTPGTYAFWPAPVPAATENLEKLFALRTGYRKVRI